MATYTLTGHNTGATATTTIPEWIRDLLQTYGVGASVTITLSGPDDTKLKAHGILR